MASTAINVQSNRKRRAWRKILADRWRRQLPLFLVLGILVWLWNLLTSTLRLLPLPYFPGPGEILYELRRDRALLGLSVVYFLRLLALDYYVAGTLTVRSRAS
ncbi:hypothetical protein MTBGP_22680 [Moorella thermoacetica]|uniref:hypothetical protein n=1 Tax=Neomoorella thermoacetica TaxID=1525 RepID=UPI0030D2BB4A